MDKPISAHTILVIETETIVALDIAYVFQHAGTRVTLSSSVEEALKLLEARAWSAVILGPTLSAYESSRLCNQLQHSGIPLVLYTGAGGAGGVCHEAPRVSYSVGPTSLFQVVERLIATAHPVGIV